jgi:hypothetical protein
MSSTALRHVVNSNRKNPLHAGLSVTPVERTDEALVRLRRGFAHPVEEYLQLQR